MCGEPVEVAYAVVRKVRNGSRWPTVERRAEEEAVEWVELLGDSVEELTAAVAAQR